MFYTIIASARLHGAIGIFYPVSVVVFAVSEYEAKEVAREQLSGRFEINYLSIKEDRDVSE